MHETLGTFLHIDDSFSRIKIHGCVILAGEDGVIEIPAASEFEITNNISYKLSCLPKWRRWLLWFWLRNLLRF